MNKYLRWDKEEVEILTKYVYPLYWRLVKNYYYEHASCRDIADRLRSLNCFAILRNIENYSIPKVAWSSYDIFLMEICYFDSTDSISEMGLSKKELCQCNSFLDKVRFVLEYYHLDYFNSQSRAILKEDFQKVIWEPLIDILTLWEKI